jgi:hypothetical protein
MQYAMLHSIRRNLPKRKNNMWFSKKQKEQPIAEKKDYTVGTKIPMQQVFIDKNGNNWYKYENNLTMPAKRAISAEVATRFADMNLTKPILKKLIEKMKEFANSGNVVDMFYLLSEIEFRLEYLGEEKTLIELSVCYFCIDGEDETDFSEVWSKKKREILDNDLEARAFFLNMAYRLTINYSNTSEVDILEYLKLNKVEDERIYHIIQELKSEDMSMTSTT